jgi:hypothetical protein
VSVSIYFVMLVDVIVNVVMLSDFMLRDVVMCIVLIIGSILSDVMLSYRHVQCLNSEKWRMTFFWTNIMLSDVILSIFC